MNPDKITCRSCGAEIVWLRTKTNKNMPVNVVTTGPPLRAPKYSEVEFDQTIHESHFITCPQADKHRRKG